MAKHTVVTMPGDGIGNQVLPEALRVLKAVGFNAEYVHADIGWHMWCNEGNALLAIDYRTFGRSEGEPPGSSLPRVQPLGHRSALLPPSYPLPGASRLPGRQR